MCVMDVPLDVGAIHVVVDVKALAKEAVLDRVKEVQDECR